MHHLKFLNARTFVLAGLVAAVFALGGLSGGTDRASANFSDPTGVFCSDITIGPPFNLTGVTMTRFDNNYQGVTNQTAVTAVAYVPNSVSCQDTPPAPVTNPVDQTTERPILVGTWSPGTQTLSGSICREDLDFGGFTFPGWTQLDFTITFAKVGKTIQAGAFVLRDDQSGSACNDTVDTDVITSDVEGKFLDGPGGDPNTFNSDWDGDGCRDWDELARVVFYDPFNDDDCSAGVGGVAELPDQRSTSLQTGESSGSSTAMIIAIASAGVAAVFATGGAAWALRRRFIR